LLQLLVRATAGWPFAACQLGATTALQITSRYRGAEILQCGNADSEEMQKLMEEIQDTYIEGVNRWFSFSATLEPLNLTISDEGANKLRSLLLSPHSVSRGGVGRGCVCIHSTVSSR
jgi:hypothetical protein